MARAGFVEELGGYAVAALGLHECLCPALSSTAQTPGHSEGKHMEEELGQCHGSADTCGSLWRVQMACQNPLGKHTPHVRPQAGEEGGVAQRLPHGPLAQEEGRPSEGSLIQPPLGDLLP